MSRIGWNEYFRKTWKWAKGEMARSEPRRDSHAAKPLRIGFADRRRKTLASSTKRAARNHARLLEAVQAAKRAKSNDLTKRDAKIKREEGWGSFTRKLLLLRDTAWRLREKRATAMESWDRKIQNLKVELGRAAAHL